MAKPNITIDCITRKVSENLLVNSKGDFIYEPRNDGTASDNFNYHSIIFTKTLKEGERYTLSFDVEVTNGNFDVVSCLIRKTDGVNSTDIHPTLINKNRIITTFIAKENEGRVYIYAGRSGSTRGNGMVVRNVVLEKGDDATPYYYEGVLSRISDENIGENLVIDGGIKKTFVNQNEVNGSQQLIKSSAYHTIQVNEQNTFYTMTIKIKGKGINASLRPYFAGTYLFGVFPLTEDYTVYSGTILTKEFQTNAIHLYGLNVEEVDVSWIKVEKGNQTTPFKPLNACYLQFQVDADIDKFEVRAVKQGNPIGRGQGLLVEKDDALYPSVVTFPKTDLFPKDYLLKSGNLQVAIIDDYELTQGEGNYTVTVYARSVGGVWNE